MASLLRSSSRVLRVAVSRAPSHTRLLSTTHTLCEAAGSTSTNTNTDPKPEAPQRRLGLISRWADKFLAKTDIIEDPDSRRLVSRGFAGALYASVLLSAMKTAGIDTSAFVAGLSVTGLTIGFAARDVASNYIAGLLLIANRPFVSGDYVRIGSGSNVSEGVVESIDMRYVYLRPKASEPLILMVPNDLVMRSTILTEDGFTHKHVARNAAKKTGSSTGASTGTSNETSVSVSALPSQTPTSTYREVVRAAWDQLGAMQEHFLRQRHSADLSRIASPNDQKVVLWLLERPERTHSDAWTRFIEENGGNFPDWIPGTLKAQIQRSS